MLNLNPLKTFVMLAALATAACDVQGALDDLEQQAIDSAFKSIADSAKANGGDAIMVTPGKEFTLTVNSAGSAINGATVKIPADALPADLKQAVLSIQVAAGAGVSSESYKVAGPTAGILLTKIPDGEQVTPLKPLSIGLPYDADTTYPAEKLVLSVAGGAGKPVIPEGSKSDVAKKQVLADTLVYNLITAMYEVDFAGGDAPADSFIYKITNADGSKSCAGWIEAAGASFTEKKFYYTGVDYSLKVRTGNIGTLSVELNDNSIPVAPATSYTVPLTLVSTSVGCTAADGTQLGGYGSTSTVLDLALSAWTGDVAGSPETCGANACTTHTGTVTAVGHFDFVTATGDIVKAAINTTIPDFTWVTNP